MGDCEAAAIIELSGIVDEIKSVVKIKLHCRINVFYIQCIFELFSPTVFKLLIQS